MRALAALAVVAAACAAPAAGSASGADAFLVAHVAPGETIELHARPFGPVVDAVGSRTDFGSRRALAVAAARADGRWLAVRAPELGNGRIGWVDTRRARLRLRVTRVKVEIDLSRRELRVHRGGRVVRRFAVAVGASGSPTPVGRFAVTDKLPGARYSSVYGCCILALSARQTRLPRGWAGGDRIGIHGTGDDASIGRPATAGCLRGAERDLRYLMRVVPVGAPVVIHP